MHSKKLTVLIMALLLLAVAGAAVAQTPKTISYQGRLTDAAGDPVVDGVYAVTFRIYDAAVGGTLLWSEAGLPVTTQKGLFTATLGSPTPFPSAFVGLDQFGPDYIFGPTPALWLETEVGGTPLTPRTQLQSVPYAMTANGVFGTSSTYPGVGLVANAEFAELLTQGYSAEEKVRLWGPNWGEIWLSDAGVAVGLTSEVTAFLSAGYNSGGTLQLGNDVGSTQIVLNGGSTGDASAILPSDAINSSEILNEPGIAIAKLNSSISLVKSDIAQDFVGVSITIPASGYIVLDGYAYMTHNDTGSVFGWTQITETSNGVHDYGVAVWTNSWHYANSVSAYTYLTTPVKATFFKTAGTYTFYLQGNAYSFNSPSASVTVFAPTWLQATYYPTSYGSVASAASAAPSDNPDVQAVSLTDPLTKQASTSYNVDLRYYELQAQKAEAEALKAQLALAQARIKAGQSTDGTTGQIIDKK